MTCCVHGDDCPGTPRPYQTVASPTIPSEATASSGGITVHVKFLQHIMHAADEPCDVCEFAGST